MARRLASSVGVYFWIYIFQSCTFGLVYASQNADSGVEESNHVCTDVARRVANIETKLNIFSEERQQLFTYFEVVTDMMKRLMKIEEDNDLIIKTLQDFKDNKQEVAQSIVNITVGVRGLKNDMVQSIEEIKHNMHEIKEEIKHEIKQEEKQEIKQEVKHEIKQEVKQEIAEVSQRHDGDYKNMSVVLDEIKTSMEEQILHIIEIHNNDNDTLFHKIQSIIYDVGNDDAGRSLNESFQGIESNTTSIPRNANQSSDISNVLFKFKPKFYSIKDYLDILNLTVALLDRNNERSIYYNMQKAKDCIKSSLAKPMRDCKDLHDFGVKTDGIYTISPTGKTSFDAYCDMTNGGWTVIQRRKCGDVVFNRRWTAYAEGFGDLNCDHWLGLKHVHDLTKNHQSQISFRFLIAKNLANATAVYNNFYIDDEAAKFRMHVKPNAVYNPEMKKYVYSSGYFSNFFYTHNNMEFSTKDADHDTGLRNCAKMYGAYWHSDCYTAKPNAKFSEMAIWYLEDQPVSRSEIKIRRMK